MSKADPVIQRSRERDRLIAVAAGYVRSLGERLPVVAAAVVGSVARGDFNVWSDIDVLVVAEQLPARTPDRSAVLAAPAPAGVQPVGFTPKEFETALRRNNPLAREALEAGVPLRGEQFLRTAGLTSGRSDRSARADPDRTS